MFSGGIKREHWPEMSRFRSVFSERNKPKTSCSNPLSVNPTEWSKTLRTLKIQFCSNIKVLLIYICISGHHKFSKTFEFFFWNKRHILKLLIIVFISKFDIQQTCRYYRDVHCVKSVHIPSFSGRHFSVFRLNTVRISPYSVRMRENTDQKSTEYGHFSRSGN